MAQVACTCRDGHDRGSDSDSSHHCNRDGAEVRGVHKTDTFHAGNPQATLSVRASTFPRCARRDNPCRNCRRDVFLGGDSRRFSAVSAAILNDVRGRVELG